MNKLKQRRLELNLTLKDIAKIAGVSEGTVSRWERGEISTIRSDHVSQYALALGMSPLDLMTTDEDAPKAMVELRDNANSRAEQIERLMAYVNFLNDDGRKKIEEYARDIYNNPSYRK